MDLRVAMSLFQGEFVKVKSEEESHMFADLRVEVGSCYLRPQCLPSTTTSPLNLQFFIFFTYQLRRVLPGQGLGFSGFRQVEKYVKVSGFALVQT